MEWIYRKDRLRTVIIIGGIMVALMGFIYSLRPGPTSFTGSAGIQYVAPLPAPVCTVTGLSGNVAVAYENQRCWQSLSQKVAINAANRMVTEVLDKQ